MIRKFITIKGTGKFLNFSSSNSTNQNWNGEFKKNNLIYGENGSGKTTLSFIFRSLKNDNSLLLKKRSFDTSIEQKIEILTDSSTHQRIDYSNNRWSNYISGIEIFDINFINDNIYTGSEIHNEHKKNLLEIIFGQCGVQLKSEISDLKESIQNTNRDLRIPKSKIEVLAQNFYTTENYCNLEFDPGIDKKIEQKEDEILIASRFEEIQQRDLLSQLNILSLPFSFENAETILIKSIETISQEFIDKFQTHRNDLSMNGNSEEWIKEGFEAIKDDKCPFCLRNLDDSIDIFVAYKQYFNEDYKQLNSEIRSINELINNFNIEAYIVSQKSKLSSNSLLIQYWGNHIPDSFNLSPFEFDKDSIMSAFESFKSLYGEKASDPLNRKRIDELETFRNIVLHLNENIIRINRQIESYNKSITVLKNRTRVDLPTLHNDLNKLKVIKGRSEKHNDDICKEYMSLNSLLDRLNLEKECKQGQLATYSDDLFQLYLISINNYLRVFAPYLEITNLESGYVGQSREPFIKYVLRIDGNDISIDDHPSQHCFKYCLSEGDKSALAFAFFLAKIENDGNLDTKIVVFDDPVSSFDLNRKSATVSQLISISQRTHQSFILTHNIVFAGEIWRELNHSTSECIKIGYLNNTSVLTNFDIKFETLASVLKDCMLIKDFLIIGTIEEQKLRAVARAIRPTLESYYHLKFFDLISDNDWLGTFIDQIRNAQPSDLFYRLVSNLSDLTDLNNYSKRYHHRFNNLADSEPIVEAELRIYCQRALDLIQII